MDYYLLVLGSEQTVSTAFTDNINAVLTTRKTLDFAVRSLARYPW